jgi:HEPN domain-containing protein
MNLNDIIKYWIESAKESLETSGTLINNSRFVHAMFFLHLAVEKMLKGYYIYSCKEDASFTHNLVVLASKIPNEKFTDVQLHFLAEVSRFNIAARYDDYKRNFYRICDKSFANSYFVKGEEFIEWLESRMK